MADLALLNQLGHYADLASQKAADYSGLLGSARHYILDTFGPNGLIAAYIAGAILLIFVVTKLVKITLATLKYLVIPSVGLAFVASLVSPFSFVAALPVAVTICSLVLLFKG